MATDEGMEAAVRAWLQSALADAGRRGLPELRPLLEGLAASMRTLRKADWNDHVPGAPDDGDAHRGGVTR